MPELMLVRHFFPDGQLPDSFRAWLRSLLLAKDMFRWSNGWGKAPIYGKQKTSNGQRDHGDAENV